MSPVDELLDMIFPSIPEDMSYEAARQNTKSRLSQFAPGRVDIMSVHARDLLPAQLAIVREATRQCMMNVLDSWQTSVSSLESTLAYALVGARTACAFMEPKFYYTTVTDMRSRCRDLGFDGIDSLLEPDSQHSVILNGMIIEDAIVNYYFETPRYYEYLGENADALLPYAEILTRDAPAGEHRLYLPRIESLIAGGSPALLDGTL